MGKAVSTHKAKLEDKVRSLFADIEAAEKQEEQEKFENLTRQYNIYFWNSL